jgi:tetratricopeptide (TPR) repeat protein
MDQQEQAFLSAALGMGDERLERRLLVGFHLVRDCCRIADDPSWVPRVRVAREALTLALANGTFAPGDLEVPALADLLRALDSEKPNRASVYAALVSYIHALYREASFPAALAAHDVLEQLWTPECPIRDRLEAAYFQGFMQLRAQSAREVSKFSPILLALRARAAGEGEFIALAGVIHHARTMIMGNLPLALREGEKRLRQLHRHPSLWAEGNYLHSMAATHGRAGRPDETLRIARSLLDDRYSSFTVFGALNLIGVAFTDLGDLEAARNAFELTLLAPTALLRRMAALGLMDIHARRMERRAFEQIYRYLINQPFAVDGRIHFFQVAGRGWARFGDPVRARASFDEAYRIARDCGFGYEIFETEELIDKLPDPPRLAHASDIAPEVAAHVGAMRDEHADEIAACLA